MGIRTGADLIPRNLKQALTKPPERFGIDPPEHLTLIDASRFLTADYSWRVFHTSAGQHEFSLILIGSLPLWSHCPQRICTRFFLNAGGLWRDEADLVHLSLLPSVSQVWQNLPHDSCPILMHLVVRAWSAAASTLLSIEQTHPFASLSQPNNCIPLRTFLPFASNLACDRRFIFQQRWTVLI